MHVYMQQLLAQSTQYFVLNVNLGTCCYRRSMAGATNTLKIIMQPYSSYKHNWIITMHMHFLIVA